MIEDEEHKKAIEQLIQHQFAAIDLLHKIDDSKISRLDIMIYFPYIYAYTANVDKVTDEILDTYFDTAKVMTRTFIDDQKRLRSNESTTRTAR